MIDEKSFRERLERALPDLKERDQDVFIYRFGFDGIHRTLREVGEILGISSSHVFQLERRALRMLRHQKRSLPELRTQEGKEYLRNMNRGS